MMSNDEIKKNDLIKIIDFIETYYARELTKSEIKAIRKELGCYTYKSFINEISETLINATDFFTVTKLHRIIHKKQETKEFLKNGNLNSWEDLYANKKFSQI